MDPKDRHRLCVFLKVCSYWLTQGQRVGGTWLKCESGGCWRAELALAIRIKEKFVGLLLVLSSQRVLPREEGETIWWPVGHWQGFLFSVWSARWVSGVENTRCWEEESWPQITHTGGSREWDPGKQTKLRLTARAVTIPFTLWPTFTRYAYVTCLILDNEINQIIK